MESSQNICQSQYFTLFLHRYKVNVTMQIFRNTENYMGNILGLEAEDKGVYALPVPMNHFFEVRKSLIEGHEFLLLSPTMEDVKPELLCKRYYKAMEMCGIPCVLVVPTITGVLRRQLIKKKVSFIVPDKQVFIPELGTILSESKLDNGSEKSVFSANTQFLLLFHLLKKDLNGCSYNEIMNATGIIKKNISTAATELANAGVCELQQGSGIEKIIVFSGDKKEVWTKSLPLMTNPIKRIGYVSTIELAVKRLPKSYEEALSHYTDVVGEKIDAYATYRLSEEAKVLNGIIQPEYEDGMVRIEFWAYDPVKLSDNGFIDPLSLYLCYRDDDDERIQGELSRLIDRTL